MILLILFLCSSLYAKEASPAQLGIRYNAPYNIDIGTSTDIGKTTVYVPYVGIGVLTARTAISWFFYAGMNISHSIFDWDIGYFQAFIPDFQLFDYKNIESYAKTDFTWKWDKIHFRFRTSVGYMLFISNVQPTLSLQNYALVIPAIRQSIGIRTWLYQGDITQISLSIDIGGEYALEGNQNSWFIQSSMPISFRFIHGKIAFMSSFFSSGYWPGPRIYQNGTRYLGYNQAVMISNKDKLSLYDFFYPYTGSLAFTYRIYTFGAPKPYNTLYAAFTADVGFGITQNPRTTNLHYIVGFALGYEYKDTSPFELRFGFDQDNNVFFHFNITSPLRHQFFK
ncbi:MAG: hypothetical protein ACRC9L_07320 [Brevinema sp.]